MNCVTLNQLQYIVKEKDTTIWEPTLGGNGGFSVSVLQTLNSPRQVVTLSATLDGMIFEVEDTATSGSLVVVEKELEVAANVEQVVTMGLAIEQGTFVLQAVEEVNGNERILASVTQQAGDVTGDAAAMHTQSMQLHIIPNTGNIKLRLSSIPLTMGNRSKATGKWITKKIKYLEQENIVVTLCDSTADRYRFGFNGQEKVNELAGLGNHNTAEFWEYDTRLGRRWNLDPVVKPWEAGYTVFSRNPMWKVDPNGDADYFNQDGKFQWTDGNDGRVIIVTNQKVLRQIKKGKAQPSQLTSDDQFELPPFEQRQKIKKIIENRISEFPNAKKEVGGVGISNKGKNEMIRVKDGNEPTGNDRPNIQLFEIIQNMPRIHRIVHEEDLNLFEEFNFDYEINYTWHLHYMNSADMLEGASKEDVTNAVIQSNFAISTSNGVSGNVYFYNKDSELEPLNEATTSNTISDTKVKEVKGSKSNKISLQNFYNLQQTGNGKN